jgi:hypothetical protein
MLLLPGVAPAPSPVLAQFAIPEFEPTCPGAVPVVAGGVGRALVMGMPWRSVAKATPAERVSRQTPIARGGMSFFISELLDSRILGATDTDTDLSCPYS